MAYVEWITIPNVSLAAAARNAGFDLGLYYEYSPALQSSLRSIIRKDARSELRKAYLQATGDDLKSINRAVYVISVGWPFAVNYKAKHSDVIYIGIGNVYSRLDSHLKHSLFDLMLSLQGIDFSFRISVPRMSHTLNFYKHVEFVMLQEFRNTIGNEEEYPLLNSNAGAEQNIKAEFDGWKLPLKNAGKVPRWLITPTKHNEFAKLD